MVVYRCGYYSLTCSMFKFNVYTIGEFYLQLRILVLNWLQVHM